MSIKNTVIAYLDARDKAAQWADARFTEEAARSERDRISRAEREALEAAIESARRGAGTNANDYAEAVSAALYDASDNNRVLAREMAWQRLLRRVERGESLDSIALDASAVELEALAAFAPAEMPHVEGNTVSRTPAEWKREVEQVVVDAYAAHPENTARFAALAQQADAARDEAALAELGAALIAGAPADGQTLNRVYGVDPALYQRVTA